MRVLETVLYAKDLDAIEAFYERVLSLKPSARPRAATCSTGSRARCCSSSIRMRRTCRRRQARCQCRRTALSGKGMSASPLPAGEIETWKARLAAEGVAIEADFEWPGGGRSIYFP